MAALIGALRATLSADTANFEAGMKRAQRQAATSAGGINKSLGLVKAGFAGFISGLSVGLITNAIRGALDYAGSLAEVAQQLGVTTRDLQNFRAAAGQSGLSTEEMDKALLKLRTTLGQVEAGAKAPTKALAAIGLSTKELAGLDTGEAFRRIADGLKGITDSSQRAAVEVALFGRTGAKLDTLLAGGSAAINELAAANERLGGVLSDEQIQRADETADKLEQLQTVLKAQIAGVVADNANAILQFASALVTVVAEIGSAINAYRQLRAEFNAGFYSKTGNEKAAEIWRGKNYKSGRTPSIPGRSVIVALDPAKPMKMAAGAPIQKFLASGGGGKKGGGGKSAEQLAQEAERKRLEALREAYQIDQEIRRADMDILSAKRQLATDFVERAALSIQMLDAEKAAHQAELDYQVAAGEMTTAQAAILQAKYAEKDSIERQIVLQEEEENRQRDFNRLEAVSYGLQRQALEAEAQLAETSSERRAIELRILDLAYREEKERLERIMRESKDWAETEAARAQLAAMPGQYASDKAGVIQSTRGPWEDYLASLPTTAAKAQEALERLQVQGMEGFIDSVLELTNGLDAAKDSLLNTLKQFLLGIARMELQKGLGSLFQSGGGFGGIFGGIFGGGISETGAVNSNAIAIGNAAIPRFAGGGSFSILGRRGIDQNMLSLNGLPIARVSYGERVNIAANDGGGGRRSSAWTGDMHVHGVEDVGGFNRSEGQIMRRLGRRLAR